MLNVLIIGTLSCISGLCYHLGGLGDDGAKKYPKLPKWLFNSKVRDWGVSIVSLVALTLLHPLRTQNWGILAILLTFCLTWGSLSTYWKKGVDCKWWNWFFHGLGIGIAIFPIIYLGISCDLIVLRAIVLGLLMTAVSESTENACWEEFGRGFLIIATIPILG